MKRVNAYVPDSEKEKNEALGPSNLSDPSISDVVLAPSADIAFAHRAQSRGKIIVGSAARRNVAARLSELRPKLESTALPPDLNFLAEHCTNPRAKFRPLSRAFNRNARALQHITGGTRGKNPFDLLAQIYGYKDHGELVAELGTRGYEGPYDDEHEAYWQSVEGMVHIRTRLVHVEDVIKTELPKFFNKYPDRVNWIIETLKLFSSANVQRIAFRKMAKSKSSFPGYLEISVRSEGTK